VIYTDKLALSRELADRRGRVACINWLLPALRSENWQLATGDCFSKSLCGRHTGCGRAETQNPAPRTLLITAPRRTRASAWVTPGC